jgi:hypothetical protein
VPSTNPSSLPGGGRPDDIDPRIQFLSVRYVKRSHSLNGRIFRQTFCGKGAVLML